MCPPAPWHHQSPVFAGARRAIPASCRRCRVPSAARHPGFVAGIRWPRPRCAHVAGKPNLQEPRATRKEDRATTEAARPAPARHTAQPQARAGRLAADSWFSLICHEEPAAVGTHELLGSGKASFRGALAAVPHRLPHNHIKVPAPVQAASPEQSRRRAPGSPRHGAEPCCQHAEVPARPPGTVGWPGSAAR